MMKPEPDPSVAHGAPAYSADSSENAGAPLPEADMSEPAKPGMVAQLRALYADGRELIDAEVGFQKARMAAAGRQVRNMAVLALVGLILVSCALIALVIGTMIALVPVLGAWGAMGATVAGSLVLALLCFWLAAGRIAKVSALFPPNDPEPDPATASSGADA